MRVRSHRPGNAALNLDGNCMPDTQNCGRMMNLWVAGERAATTWITFVIARLESERSEVA